MRSILIVINPSSGGSSYKDKLGFLEARLRESGLRHSNFFTEQEGQGKLTRYLELNPRINEIAILGGDGTLNYVVNELQPKPLPLSMVSNGTGNDSVKSLHGEMNFEKQVEIAVEGRLAQFDLGVCNGRAFVNGVGIGFDGQVVQRMLNRKKKRGSHLDYLLTVLKTVAGFQEKELRFNLDGRKEARKILLMTIANGTTFGGGFMINPLASSRDGMLDVCILTEIPPLLRFWHLPKLKTGAHKKMKESEFHKALEVHVEASEELVAHLDGEFIGHPPFEISILPDALTMRVP